MSFKPPRRIEDKPKDSSLYLLWAARIKEWQESSKSGIAWCQEQKLVYSQFIYWKSRVVTGIGSANNSRKASFIELPDEPQPAIALEIEYRGVLIRLPRDFNETSLNRCLKVIERAIC